MLQVNAPQPSDKTAFGYMYLDSFNHLTEVPRYTIQALQQLDSVGRVLQNRVSSQWHLDNEALHTSNLGLTIVEGAYNMHVHAHMLQVG